MARIFNWSKTADFEEGDETDFDAETDTDGDLNAATAAAHDGAYGIEITFDNNTVAEGGLDASAVNQTTGSALLWFDPNSVTLASTKSIMFCRAVDGGAASNWSLWLYNNAGTYQVRMRHIDDAAAWQSDSYFDLADAYQKIIMVWQRSSAGGADDGWMRLYIGDALRSHWTGHDNDTLDWDAVYSGMTYTDQTASFGGSFYMDTIKISSDLYFLEDFIARHHDYNFNAPQHFKISSNSAQSSARQHDYNFNAPKRE